ncbi:BMP family ABC transporter substrate-binding protein [Actinotalea sp. BY-33]|uniref:BMP family ABC transporter substrate-binding protein n=1 Tax=Actinotalea soli TaxID=2819234 RepID=A0A939LRT4_9CELL|nr:BMP family ABC transporter substrate-binding protein [Actinotalea soli]MBO1751880.1 BMP family ABC transporter substrate-binding protein [Actinotalea soli]
MKIATRAAVLVTASALALAACGAAPEDEPEETTAGGEEETVDEIDFKGCIVSDQGGFDDRSFNQAGYEGLQLAQESLGIETAQAESTAETDFVPNIDSMVNQACDLTVTVGFLLAGATGEAAEANPDATFAIIDDQSIDLPNVKPIVFNTAEAAFLAGYLAAGYSTTGTVATFGGMAIPPVTIFMDGFVDGVAHYNEVKGAEVTVLGWNKDEQSGEFTGNFEDIAAGQNVANAFIDAGADVIMPVAGPVGGGAASAAQEAGDVAFIGVDSDWFDTSPEYADIILTSVLKQMGPAVFDVINESVQGNFSNEAYVGTLENEGVALAPFHDLDSSVSAELKSELEEIQAQIIAGEIVVESQSTP